MPARQANRRVELKRRTSSRLSKLSSDDEIHFQQTPEKRPKRRNSDQSAITLNVPKDKEENEEVLETFPRRRNADLEVIIEGFKTADSESRKKSGIRRRNRVDEDSAEFSENGTHRIIHVGKGEELKISHQEYKLLKSETIKNRERKRVARFEPSNSKKNRNRNRDYESARRRRRREESEESSSDEAAFQRKQNEKLESRREEMMPINKKKASGKVNNSSKADIDPVAVDSNINFDSGNQIKY